MTTIAADQLRQFVEQIERLEEEKTELAAQIRDIYLHAKSSGFDAKALRQIIRIRKMDQHEVDELDSLVDLYKQALGML